MMIRRYQKSDAPACCEIVNTAIEDMEGLNDEARARIRAKNTPDQLHLALEGGHTLVSEENGRLIGVAGLFDSEIQRLYVRPEAQRKGVGRALVEALEQEAKRRGYKTIDLDASPSSVPFYEHFGYIARRKTQMDREGAVFHFVVMTKHLT
jgi:putative acetyltransferase